MYKLELPSDAMKYVIINERLMEALSTKWQVGKSQNCNITLQTSTQKIAPNTSQKRWNISD